MWPQMGGGGDDGLRVNNLSVVPSNALSLTNSFAPSTVNLSASFAHSDALLLPNPGQQVQLANQKYYYYINPGGELYSRKVFVGGLPIDIPESEMYRCFGTYGNVVVDWPHKNHPPFNGAYVAPKGYVFLIYETEAAVRKLVESCYTDGDKHYLFLSSPTMPGKPVQVRPWLLADSDFVVNPTLELTPRRTVFLGGVPRPFKAIDLATHMDNLFGNVCYAGIDTDPELKYPKGAGRVGFAKHESYIAAINAKFVNIKHGGVDKRVEVKPYVLDEQKCDECGGDENEGKFAQYFCGDVSCLQYYCAHCWATIHAAPNRANHTPFVKERSGRMGSNFPQRLFQPSHQVHSATAALHSLQMMEPSRGPWHNAPHYFPNPNFRRFHY